MNEEAFAKAIYDNLSSYASKVYKECKGDSMKEMEAELDYCTIDQLRDFWNAAFEAGYKKGYEDCEKDHPETILW